MSAAWRLRFNRELTDQTLARARGYAEKLIAHYHQAEGIVDLRAPHDIVNQAVADTLAGIRTWDPDREPPKGGIPLYRHLCRVVYSRAYHDKARRKRQRSVSFHEVNVDSDESIDNVVETRMSLKRTDERRHPDYQVMLREMKERLYTPAKEHAKGDREVLDYIGCLEDGVFAEPDIKRRCGWDTKQFDRIKLRYLTAIKRIPEQVRRDAMELIARSPALTGDDWRKAKGTEIGARDARDEEDDDSPFYEDDDRAGYDQADEEPGEEERDD